MPLARNEDVVEAFASHVHDHWRPSGHGMGNVGDRLTMRVAMPRR